MLKILNLESFNIKWSEITSDIIYCLYIKRFNIIDDNLDILEDYSIIAYSDNKYEIYEYVCGLLENDIIGLENINIVSIPNIKNVNKINKSR